MTKAELLLPHLQARPQISSHLTVSPQWCHHQPSSSSDQIPWVISGSFSPHHTSVHQWLYHSNITSSTPLPSVLCQTARVIVQKNKLDETLLLALHGAPLKSEQNAKPSPWSAEPSMIWPLPSCVCTSPCFCPFIHSFCNLGQPHARTAVNKAEEVYVLVGEERQLINK